MISLKWKVICLVTQVLTAHPVKWPRLLASSSSATFSCSLCFSHTDVFFPNANHVSTSGLSICGLECSSPRILHRWFLPVFQGSAHRPSSTTQAKNPYSVLLLISESVTVFITIGNHLVWLPYYLSSHPCIKHSLQMGSISLAALTALAPKKKKQKTHI